MDQPTLVLPLETKELFLRGGRPGLEVPLWVAGSLDGLAAPAVAIVGTRIPSEAGRRLAFGLARELAGAGVCVVSGLAVGIDAEAHLGALEAGGPTVGVLGGGTSPLLFHGRTASWPARTPAGGGAVVSPVRAGPAGSALAIPRSQRNRRSPGRRRGRDRGRRPERCPEHRFPRCRPRDSGHGLPG